MKKAVKVIIGVSSVLLSLGVATAIVVPTAIHANEYPSAPRVNKNKKHIACIGDSITYGTGVLFRDYESYPACLSKKVSKDFQVLNYGLSGRTAMTSGNRPYTEESFYQISKDVEADIYIIMLGTNDSKAKNWNKSGEDGENYKEDLKNLVLSYKNLQNSPSIYLMQPPKAFPNGKSNLSVYSIDDSIISTSIYEIVKEVSQELNVGCIDLYNLTKDHPNWYMDGVHPNASGYKAIANYINESINYTTN